ncbi:MAG TPA: hypothetical protein VIR81_16240, partial [Myxococcales bacterium]
RPAAIAALGAGVASAVVGIALQARADSTASDPTRRAIAGADGDANLARGFYVAAAVLAAAGGGLLWWDLHTDSLGVQTRF